MFGCFLFFVCMADSAMSLSAVSEVQGTSFQKGGNQANTRALSGYVGSAEVEEMNSGTGSASDFPGSSDTLDALPPVATAEKVNQWNKNTLVWLRAPRTLVLDELLPAALPAPPAATEPLPQSAATAGDNAALSASSAATVPLPPSAAPAVVQPASGSDPARLPFASIEPVRGPHLVWLQRWIMFEHALTKEAQQWEWVKIEKEEQGQMVNSKPKAEHVTNLATLARLHGLEEENLMFWIFAYGEEEGQMRAIDELHDQLNFETESVASEVPWKGEVLQVHQKVSPQPTKKEEVRFLFRGSGCGLGMQRVHGGSSLMKWYLGLQGQGLEEDFGGYFITLGGKIFDPLKEVSGLGVCGLQEVVFNGRIRDGAARGTGKVEVPYVGEWQCTFCGAAHCWNTRVSCYRCGTHRNWQSGGAGPGSLVGGQGQGNGVQPGVVGQRSGGGGGFFPTRWSGVCNGRVTLVRPNWS